MSELPKVAELDIPLTAEERYARLAAAQVGTQDPDYVAMSARIGAEAVANAILNTVEISLWVRGREIRTTVDDETLHRIMAILMGEP